MREAKAKAAKVFCAGEKVFAAQAEGLDIIQR